MPIFPIAISSAMILVVARFMPERAIVIQNPYTDIINPYKPIASAPIFCDMYELKNIPIQRKIRDVRVKINPFRMNVFMIFIA